jgi:hypothetical protein
MLSTSLKAFGLIASVLLLISCASPKIAQPTEYCSPMRGDKLVCNSKTIIHPEAGGMLCFYPHEIEPFLNRCGAP